MSSTSAVAISFPDGINLGDGDGDRDRSPSPDDAPPRPPATVMGALRDVAVQVAWATAAGDDPAALSDPLIRVDGEGRIHVVVHSLGPAGGPAEDDLRALGGTDTQSVTFPPTGAGPASGAVRAWLPHDQLDEAAALPWAAGVTLPHSPMVLANLSEGVALHQADDLQAKGITGAGVKIGVVSDGVENLAAAQASGDLPATGITVLAAGDGDEGTAMLEILHDMAPAASLVFSPVGADQISFIASLDALVAAGANVIVHDIGFLLEPKFQQGPVAARIDQIAQAGVPVHAAAGNLGDSHVPQVPAVGTGTGPDGQSGPFTGCTVQPDNVVDLVPGAAVDTTFDITVPPGVSSSFFLQWSEPGRFFPTLNAGGFTDLNLYLMDAGLTKCLDESVEVQGSGVGDTFEAISGSSAPGFSAKLVVSVEGTSSAVAPPTLDLSFVGAFSVDTPARAGSVAPNGNFTSGLAVNVAAVRANTALVEPFSSGGPVILWTTTTCPSVGGVIPPGPCTGVAGPAPQTFQGVAWAGADGVSVSGAGGFPNPFFGTSAAAPHSAACDALVRDAIDAPASPPKPVLDRLAASTALRPPVGIDEVTGNGVLDCLAAARVSQMTFTFGADRTGVAPGGTVVFNATLTNNGPDAAPAPSSFKVDLPPGLTFVSSTDPCTAAAATAAGQVVTCTAPPLADDAIHTFTFTTTATAPVNTVLSTTATLLGDAAIFDITPADNTISFAVTVTPDGSAPAVPVTTTTSTLPTSTTLLPPVTPTTGRPPVTAPPVTAPPVTAGVIVPGTIVSQPLARTGSDDVLTVAGALLLLIVGAHLWRAGASPRRRRTG